MRIKMVDSSIQIADIIIRNFLSGIPSLNAAWPQQELVKSFREIGQPLPPWTVKPGVYIFVLDGQVKYVGRALRTTLGQRIWDRCNQDEATIWMKDVILKSTCKIYAVILPKDEWFWAAALEALLIHELQPEFSKRVS
jgi:hypothetical protein